MWLWKPIVKPMDRFTALVWTGTAGWWAWPWMISRWLSSSEPHAAAHKVWPIEIFLVQCQILNVFNRVAVPAPDAVAGDPFCLHPAAGHCLLLLCTRQQHQQHLHRQDTRTEIHSSTETCSGRWFDPTEWNGFYRRSISGESSKPKSYCLHSKFLYTNYFRDGSRFWPSSSPQPLSATGLTSASPRRTTS